MVLSLYVRSAMDSFLRLIDEYRLGSGIGDRLAAAVLLNGSTSGGSDEDLRRPGHGRGPVGWGMSAFCSALTSRLDILSVLSNY